MESRVLSRTEELLNRRRAAVPRGVFNVAPIFADSAEGVWLHDVDGKTYLDFAGGLGVLNVGHRHPHVLAALRAQLDRYLHTCFHVAMYEPYVALAERLNEITPGDFPKKTMLVNSGAEAVENAVKIARAATGRKAVITFEHAFHGRTLLGLSLTSKVDPYKVAFGPFAPEVYRVPYPYPYRCPQKHSGTCTAHVIATIEEAFRVQVDAGDVAAVIIEPVTGEGGFIVPPPDFLPALADLCRRHGILLIADEVQTGFGRTGRVFAVDHAGVEPDLLVAGKSLASGLPLASVTGRADLMEAPQVGGLGGTYGGNPLACVAALAVIDVLQSEGFLERAQALGANVLARFQTMQRRFPVIGEVRGLGAMVGMELVEDRESKTPARAATAQVLAACLERGLLILKSGVYDNVIRILVPLVISDEDLERGLNVLEEALAAVAD
ncbi:MAG: 4-aminobutyrate aminotransferase [Armatimonadetes bacterium CSP1-3]|nr:MAG: 4-aminobutyrate aminotransferase [Armatimonadetes bacterium CSP1-3]